MMLRLIIYLLGVAFISAKVGPRWSIPWSVAFMVNFALALIEKMKP